LALLAALLVAAPAAQARNVSVAVVGDSVQEGYTVQDFADGFASIDPARAGLAPALQDALGRGGYGFVPAHPARWTLGGEWLATGYGFGTAGPSGASGYGPRPATVPPPPRRTSRRAASPSSTGGVPAVARSR
jgi:hypothetical protein